MENLMETGQSEVALIIQNSIPILKEAPKVLNDNELIKTKAIKVGQNIIAAYKTNGLSPELDERALKFLNNISIASKKMKEDRSGITQIMDELKKMYTTIESEVDIKKQGTVPFQVQEIRNAYAKKVAEDAERKRKEAEAIENKKKEAIDIRFKVSNDLTNQFNDYLSEKKLKINQAFNSITLETYETKAVLLRALAITFNMSFFKASNQFPKYHTNEDVNSIIEDVIQENATKLESLFVTEIASLKSDLVDKLPSLLSELQEQKRLADEAEQLRLKGIEEQKQRQAAIDKANEDDRKKLQAEAEEKKKIEQKRLADLKAEQDRIAEDKRKREQEDNERIAREGEELKAQAMQADELKMQGEKTMAMFEKEASIAETTEAPEVRQGFSITVLHPVGFTQIFALWFEKVGKNLGVDKLGNTKLDQMKAWAEKEAHKSGTKIDSKFIKYEETYSAVNRK